MDISYAILNDIDIAHIAAQNPHLGFSSLDDFRFLENEVNSDFVHFISITIVQYSFFYFISLVFRMDPIPILLVEKYFIYSL